MEIDQEKAMERVLMCIMGDHPHPLPGGGTTHDRFAQIAEATKPVAVTLFIVPDLRNVMGDTQFGDPKWDPKWGPKLRTIHSMRLLASRLAKDGDRLLSCVVTMWTSSDRTSSLKA